MHKQVLQYREDEHQKKLMDKDLKNQRLDALQKQMDDNKKIKDQKLKDEKAKDAALQKEYDRMMQEREQARGANVRL